MLESLVRDPALIDGNKRLSWLSLVVCPGLNGIELAAPYDPANHLAISVARGQDDCREIAAQLSRWQ